MRILLHVETFGKKYGLGKQNWEWKDALPQ